jgi:hypothetical protein
VRAPTGWGGNECGGRLPGVLAKDLLQDVDVGGHRWLSEIEPALEGAALHPGVVSRRAIAGGQGSAHKLRVDGPAGDIRNAVPPDPNVEDPQLTRGVCEPIREQKEAPRRPDLGRGTPSPP